jgi:hypothetical protein
MEPDPQWQGQAFDRCEVQVRVHGSSREKTA